MSSLETQLRQMQRILAISHALVSNRSLDDILHQIVQVAAELTDCETAGILLAEDEPNTLRFVAVSLYEDRLFNLPVPIDASIAGTAFTRNQPIIANSPNADARYYSKIAELVNYPARSLLAVPLKFRDHKIGALEAENKNAPQRFDHADAQVLTALAAQATIAIENARQIERYKQLAQAQQELLRMTDALRDASTALTSTLDYDQVIDRILEQIAHVIPSDTCNMMLIETANIARVFRGRGYAPFGTAATLNTTTLNVAQVAGLRRMRETRRSIVVPDVTRDPTWVYSRPEHHWIRAYVGAPIIVRDQVVGFLNVMSATQGLYTETHGERLQAFANHAASAIANAQLYRQAQIEIAERSKVEAELRHHRDHLEEVVRARTAELEHLAITDSLTSVFNRRHLFILGEQAIEQARRYCHALAAMMIDIDHFKQVNDAHGHAAGDLLLKKLAEHLQANLRAADILGRYGGEEFVVLMPETDLETARQSAERLLADIRTVRLITETGPVGFTTSIGIALFVPQDNAGIDALIQRADRAMYAAKQAGRNRIFSEPVTDL